MMNNNVHISTRWKLPEAMQIDLREITREAVEFLISHEQSMQGRYDSTIENT